MSSAATLRRQIEIALAHRIPSALTPAPRTIRPVAATGIQAIDELLEGGLPLGAVTEVVGPECSGRTSFALSFLAGMTHAARVCAWIDVSDTLYDKDRLSVTRSKFLEVEGSLQNQDGVIHVRATWLVALSDRALDLRSHDFH